MNMPAKKDLQEAASGFRHAAFDIKYAAEKIIGSNYLLSDEEAFAVARDAKELSVRVHRLANRCYGYLDLEEEENKDG